MIGARDRVGATTTAASLALTLARSGTGFVRPGSVEAGPDADRAGPFGGRERGAPTSAGPEGSVVVVEATRRPAARGVLADLTGPGDHAEAWVEVRRFCPRTPVAGGSRGPEGTWPKAMGGSADYRAQTELLARRCSWLVTDASPETAHEDPDGIVGTADDLVLVTTVGVAGAVAAQKTLEALHRRGAEALAGRCVLVLTGVKDAGRPIGRGQARAFFEECCGAVVTLPRAANAAWPWSRRPLRELAYLLMPAHADDA